MHVRWSYSDQQSFAPTDLELHNSFTSYTAGLLILYEAAQKSLNQQPASVIEPDLSLASDCIEILGYCAEVDTLAGAFKGILSVYAAVISDSVSSAMEINQELIREDDGDISYLFELPSGNTDLHKTAKDLLHLLDCPFDCRLSMVPAAEHKDFPVENTLVHMMEAAMGAHLEWEWEIRNCSQRKSVYDDPEPSSLSKAVADPGASASGNETGQSLTGRFMDPGDGSGWSTWTSYAF